MTNVVGIAPFKHHEKKRAMSEEKSFKVQPIEDFNTNIHEYGRSEVFLYVSPCLDSITM